MNWPVMPTYNIIQHMDTLFNYAEKASTILEIGCETGCGSTMAFETAINFTHKSCKHISVDIVDMLKRRPSFIGWTFILGDSRSVDTVNRVKSNMTWPGGFDLIFIDTLHTYEQMRQELSVWQQLADNHTIWLFHDTWMEGKYNPMTDAIKEFADASNGVWEYSDLSKTCNGLGKMEKPK